MARRFDPVSIRSGFDKFLLNMELSTSADKYPVLGSAAITRLGGIIEAWLVGLNVEIEPALKQCYAWLQHSIETKESLGDIFIPAARGDAFSLCNWMLNNKNDKAMHQESLNNYDFYFKQGGVKSGPDIFNKETQQFELNMQSGLPISAEEILNGYLGDYLADCIQGGEYERGVLLYEKVGGRTDIDSKRMKKIIEFGYWLCLQKLESNEASVDNYRMIGERVLKLHLQGQWLNHGQAIRSVIWLKILYWHSGVTTTPLDTILKAYDLMPDVPKPAR